MGGFLGMAGAISGIGSAMREKNLMEMQQEQQRRDRATQLFLELGMSGQVTDPNLAMQFIQNAAQIMSTPTHKKLAKELEQAIESTSLLEQLQRPYQPPPMKVGAQTIEMPVGAQITQAAQPQFPPMPPSGLTTEVTPDFQRQFTQAPIPEPSAPGGVPGGLALLPAPPPGIGRMAIPPQEIPSPSIPGFLSKPQMEEISQKRKSALAISETEAEGRLKDKLKQDQEQRIRSMPEFKKLSPETQASWLSGISFSRERPPMQIAGTVPGSALLEYLQEDAMGNPIKDDDSPYKVLHQNGVPVRAYPQASVVREKAFFQDIDSKRTGWTLGFFDQSGKLMRYQRDMIPPRGYLPTVTETMAIVEDAEGNLRMIPYTRRTTPVLGAPVQVGAGTDRAERIPPPPPGIEGATQPAPVTMPRREPAGRPGTPSGPGVIVGTRKASAEEERLWGNAGSGLRAIARIKQLLTEDPSLPLKAATPGSFLARRYAAALNEAKEVIVRARSGMATRSSEEDFYAAQLPTATDFLAEQLGEPNVISEKLQRYEILFKFLSSRRAAARAMQKIDPNDPNSDVIGVFQAMEELGWDKDAGDLTVTAKDGSVWINRGGMMIPLTR